MIRFNLLVLTAFLLAGCGGDFSSSWSRAGVDADIDAMAPSTGGAPGTGGAFQETGGSPTTGGAPETGGAPTTGGTPSTGGAPTTGGVSSTGGAPATGGAPVVDAGCALVTHDNGLGQTWQDCVPLGTHDSEQASKACEAFCSSNGCFGINACWFGTCGSASYVFAQTEQGADAVGWAYATGDVVRSKSTGCTIIGGWN